MQNAQIEVGCAQDGKIYTFLFFGGVPSGASAQLKCAAY